MDKRIIAGVVLGVTVVLAMVFWPGGEEEKIRKRLDEVIELTEVDVKESVLVAASTAARVGKYFTENCLVQGVPDVRNTISGRDELVALGTALRQQVSSLSISVSRVNILLSSNEDSAEMTLVAKAEAEAHGQTENAETNLSFAWVKRDGEWLIDEVASF